MTFVTILFLPEFLVVNLVGHGVCLDEVMSGLVDIGPNSFDPWRVFPGPVSNDGDHPRLVEGQPFLHLKSKIARYGHIFRDLSSHRLRNGRSMLWRTFRTIRPLWGSSSPLHPQFSEKENLQNIGSFTSKRAFSVPEEDPNGIEWRRALFHWPSAH